MREKDILKEIGDISILFQYLYMAPEHHIIVNNGLTDLKFEIDEYLHIRQTNMSFPEFGSSIEPLDLTNMLGIIDKLREQKAEEFPERFASRWEEIKTITMGNLALNFKK